jgi:hypothetical protein
VHVLHRSTKYTPYKDGVPTLKEKIDKFKYVRLPYTRQPPARPPARLSLPTPTECCKKCSAFVLLGCARVRVQMKRNGIRTMGCADRIVMAVKENLLALRANGMYSRH